MDSDGTVADCSGWTGEAVSYRAEDENGARETSGRRRQNPQEPTNRAA
jgi:hypothetical protein